MNIYVARGKGVSIDPLLPHLHTLAVNSGFNRVDYTWYTEGVYNPEDFAKADILFVYLSDLNSPTIGRGVYEQIMSARDSDVAIYVIAKDWTNQTYFIQYLDPQKVHLIDDGKNWTVYAKMNIHGTFDIGKRPRVSSITLPEFFVKEIGYEKFSWDSNHIPEITFQGSTKDDQAITQFPEFDDPYYSYKVDEVVINSMAFTVTLSNDDEFLLLK